MGSIVTGTASGRIRPADPLAAVWGGEITAGHASATAANPGASPVTSLQYVP